MNNNSKESDRGGSVTLVRNPSVPNNRECLRNPGFECNCSLQDLTKRVEVLRKIRQDMGIYENSIALLDSSVAKEYEKRRMALCEGPAPSKLDLVIRGIRNFFR